MTNMAPKKPRTFEELFEGITNEQLLEAARKALSRMCNGDRRWQMTVPVQWDDSDTCIGQALRRWERAESRLAEAVLAWRSGERPEDCPLPTGLVPDAPKEAP